MPSIVSPLLTEKSAADIDKGLYVFYVTPAANKTTVRQELKATFNVDPTSVRIVNLPAKTVTFRRRKGLQKVRRKAYVQLPPKQMIPGFESLKEKDKKEKEENAK